MGYVTQFAVAVQLETAAHDLPTWRTVYHYFWLSIAGKS
jgi:hypothetical protein